MSRLEQVLRVGAAAKQELQKTFERGNIEPGAAESATQPVVAETILYWWRTRSSYSPAVLARVTEQWEEFIGEGITDWQSLWRAATAIGQRLQEAGYRHDGPNIFYSLRSEIKVALQNSVEGQAVMVELAGNAEGTGPDDAQVLSREERQQIAEWLMRGGLEEAASQIARARNEPPAALRQRLREIRDRREERATIPIPEVLLERRATSEEQLMEELVALLARGGITEEEREALERLRRVLE